jgi:hypothetical protein
MGVEVEPAAGSHFPALYQRFLQPLNPRLGRSGWRRLFEHPWAAEDQAPGYVLLDGDDLVGFAGYVNARLPMPDGSTEPVCNITTWVADPRYGAQALSLLMPALAEHDTTITNLTSLPSVHEMFSRLGFAQLDGHVQILRPTPFARSPCGRPQLLSDPRDIVPELPGWEARIAEDHRSYASHLLLIERGGSHCYVIYTLGSRRRVRSARLHWVTPGTLAWASVALRRALFRSSHAALVEIDSRLAPSDLPGSFRLQLPVPRLFRSSGLLGPEVPNAYSETVLLEVW